MGKARPAHFMIIDQHGVGRCKYCGYTKHYPTEEKPRLSPAELRSINNGLFKSLAIIGDDTHRLPFREQP
jgi:hypothetical protein